MWYGDRSEEQRNAPDPRGGSSVTVTYPQVPVAPREGGRKQPRSPQGSPGRQEVQGLADLYTHPKVDDDLERLPEKVQGTYHDRVDLLRSGQRHPSTHPLNGPLKGWQGTSIGGNQHRIIHRFNQGNLEVVSAGSHDQAYDSAIRRKQTLAGQAGPDYDNLSFRHGEHPLYPSEGMEYKTIFAHHPEHGDVGRLHYREMDHPAWTGMPEHAVHVTMMHVEPEHRRRGVAGQLMNHLEETHPNVSIDHGSRREDGEEWAKSHYNDPKGGKPNYNGEYEGAKSSWTLNGKPWNVNTKKPYRMPKKSSAQTDALDSVGRQEHPNVDQYQSGGIGHLEGDPSRSVVGFLPTRMVAPLRGNEIRDWDKVDSIKKDIESGKGITNPLRVTYDHKNGWGYLGEGNHRLEAAKAAGSKTVPVTVDRGSAEHEKRNGIGGPMKLRTDLNSGHVDPSYVPSNMHPYHFIEDQEQHKEAARFTPDKRVFTATCGLDHRLWTTDETLKPEVRTYVINSINAMWNYTYAEWPLWARIYFAGSEASEWTSESLEGNGDFDVLVGVQYDLFRETNVAYGHMSNQEITDEMNQGFRSYNSDHVWIPIHATEDVEGEKIWHPSSNSISNGLSTSTSKTGSPLQQSQEKQASQLQPYVELSNLQELLAIRQGQRARDAKLPVLSVSSAQLNSISQLIHIMQGSSPYDVGSVKPNMLETGIFRESTISRQNSTTYSLTPKGEDALSAELQRISTWITTTDVVPGSSHVASALEAFSVLNTTGRLALSEMTTWQPQAIISEGTPEKLLPEGWTWTGPWSRTSYVNPDSYDIKRIKPYAAYDVVKSSWVVRPPHLPHWGLSELPRAVQAVLRAADSYARHVLKLPEPERTQQGAALFDSWHSDRSRAFSDKGEGWWDIANLREKWLDQAGLWAEIVNCKHRANQGLDAAPADWSNTPTGYTASIETMRPSELAKLPGRSDLDEPHQKHKLDSLRDSISQHGYVPGWGGSREIIVSHGPGGPKIQDGNHRVRVLNDLGYDAPIPIQRSGSVHLSMSWHDDGTVKNPQPRSVRHAGFKSYVGDSDTEDMESENNPHHRDFDEDAWDHTEPHPTHEERKHFEEHDEYPDSHHERHEQAYAEHMDRKQQENIPDSVDDHLSHFTIEHSTSLHPWSAHGTLGPVDISKGVHATQSHVSQFHIDRYRKNPKDLAWSLHGTEPEDQDTHFSNYPGHQVPLMVTHHGKLHAIEGHHRVARALQDGDKTIHAWHYDLDKHPVVQNPERDYGKGNVFPAKDCEECKDHERYGEDGRLPYKNSARGNDLYGAGDADALFKGHPATGAPFPRANRSKIKQDYDHELVKHVLSNPEEHHMQDVDTRDLHSTQPMVTRAAVEHYMGDQYDKHGTTFADQHNAGNRRPVIYKREDGQNLILSGHHRAVSSHLQGKPLQALVIHGPWGPPRGQ